MFAFAGVTGSETLSGIEGSLVTRQHEEVPSPVFRPDRDLRLVREGPVACQAPFLREDVDPDPDPVPSLGDDLADAGKLI